MLQLLLKKHVYEVTKDFFLSTRVPIQAFQLNGDLIHSMGYNAVFNRVFDSQNIHEKMTQRTVNSKPTNIVTISCLENIYFTSCPICPRNPHRGIFILGPYSSYENNNIKAVYKPESLMPHLLSFLDSLCVNCPNKSLPTPNTKPYNLHVKKAIDYIDARYMDPITLTTLSKHLNISKPYLCLLFKEDTQQTFTEFLNHLRIEKSKELLLEGNQSVLDIALSVGYNNQNYYNIIFKKLTNQTPLEFRKSG